MEFSSQYLKFSQRATFFPPYLIITIQRTIKRILILLFPYAVVAGYKRIAPFIFTCKLRARYRSKYSGAHVFVIRRLQLQQDSKRTALKQLIYFFKYNYAIGSKRRFYDLDFIIKQAKDV